MQQRDKTLSSVEKGRGKRGGCWCRFVVVIRHRTTKKGRKEEEVVAGITGRKDTKKVI